MFASLSCLSDTAIDRNDLNPCCAPFEKGVVEK